LHQLRARPHIGYGSSVVQRAVNERSTIMSGYRHILLGVDLSGESEQVVARAVALRNAFGSELSVIHVIEPLSFAYGGDIPMDFSGIQEEIHKQAKSHMSSLCAPLNIPERNRHLVVGRPETEIHHVAEEIGADLIVVGSHGRHGLSLLMGSTANGVLHGAKCDVLAVRVSSAAK
jgi:universal stress protein A